MNGLRFKIYYNKNLKMSDVKLAAQVGHVMKELGRTTQSVPQEDVIVVLGLSATKFNEMIDKLNNYKYNYCQIDNGLTEVPAGTKTVCGFVEE